MQHPPPLLKHNQPCQVKRLVTNGIELHSSISIRFRDGRLEPNDYLMPQKTLEFPIFFPLNILHEMIENYNVVVIDYVSPILIKVKTKPMSLHF